MIADDRHSSFGTNSEGNKVETRHLRGRVTYHFALSKRVSNHFCTVSPVEESSDKLVAARREKLSALQSKGLDPFQHRQFDPDGSVGQVRDAFTEGKIFSVAGRVTAHRDFGKSHFFDLTDLTGRIQIYFNVKTSNSGTSRAFRSTRPRGFRRS